MGRWVLTAVAACVGVVGVSAADPKPEELRKAAGEARDALKAACSRCHVGEGSSMAYKFDVTNADTLVKPAGKAKKAVVVPGKPDESDLWQAIADERMPYIDSPEEKLFKPAQLAAVKKWIELGAPPFPRAGEERRAKDGFVTAEKTLTAVEAFLTKKPAKERERWRFFSVATAHNHLDLSDAEVKYQKAALAKAVNSLTWANGIVQPVEVPGPAGTLLAVDIHELKWHEKGRWDEVLKAYPYGLGYGNTPALRGVEENIAALSEGALPVVRADWFVTTAVRPPLYHKLLDLPDNAKVLEKRLGIDIAANFEATKDGKSYLWRAGFPESGVSAQNRLLERHEIKDGGGRAYWKSYDFLPGAAKGRLAVAPLGPTDLFAPRKHPFEAVAFAHDGGEVIFHLPNGMQAYLLVNGKDERIDEGPINVVHDNNRTSGTPAIVNGVSCMACHSQGMIPFTDAIRDKAAVFGDVAARVRDLYPDAAAMKKLVDKDAKKYQDAQEEAVGPWLKDSPDVQREPVQVVASQHRLRRVTLEMAAWELGFETADALLKKVGEEPFLKLGLEALKDGKAIPRLEWESGRNPGRSLMQRLAATVGHSAK